jgi:serine/threonine-protein kinase RsbW
VNSEQARVFEETIDLVNDLSELNRLNQKFEQLFTTQKIDSKTLFYLNLVGDELITNIISYGYEDEREHIIILHLVITPTYWTLRIQDDGRPFNPLKRANPELLIAVEERAVGGLGIHFVNQIMDEISYERNKSYNIIYMKKHYTLGNEA